MEMKLPHLKKWGSVTSKIQCAEIGCGSQNSDPLTSELLLSSRTHFSLSVDPEVKLEVDMLFAKQHVNVFRVKIETLLSTRFFSDELRQEVPLYP